MKKIITLLCFAVLSSFKTVTPTLYQNTDIKVQVITNNSNTIDALTKKQLRSLFLGETTRWKDKQKVVLAIMKSNTPMGKLIAENVLDVSVKDMDKHYLTMVFQGKISAPKSFTSESELRLFVLSTPGAIGIIEKSNVGEAPKVLKIDGSEHLVF